MKTKLLLWLTVASISTAVWASEPAPYAGSDSTPEALTVHRLDATICSTMLDNIQTIRFSANETEMRIFTVDQQVLTYGIPDILKVTFGEYLTDDETTQVETSFMASPDNTRKVIENGQLIIIQNGIKYNVLGIRL